MASARFPVLQIMQSLRALLCKKRPPTIVPHLRTMQQINGPIQRSTRSDLDYIGSSSKIQDFQHGSKENAVCLYFSQNFWKHICYNQLQSYLRQSSHKQYYTSLYLEANACKSTCPPDCAPPEELTLCLVKMLTGLFTHCLQTALSSSVMKIAYLWLGIGCESQHSKVAFLNLCKQRQDAQTGRGVSFGDRTCNICAHWSATKSSKD